MDLDIPAESGCADTYHGPEKIGAAVGVWYAGVYHADGAVIEGAQAGEEDAVPLPDPLEGRFRDARHLPEVLFAVAADLLAEGERRCPRRISVVLA